MLLLSVHMQITQNISPGTLMQLKYLKGKENGMPDALFLQCFVKTATYQTLAFSPFLSSLQGFTKHSTSYISPGLYPWFLMIDLSAHRTLRKIQIRG